jgi:hypothetical protein
LTSIFTADVERTDAFPTPSTAEFGATLISVIDPIPTQPEIVSVRLLPLPEIALLQVTPPVVWNVTFPGTRLTEVIPFASEKVISTVEAEAFPRSDREGVPKPTSGGVKSRANERFIRETLPDGSWVETVRVTVGSTPVSVNGIE